MALDISDRVTLMSNALKSPEKPPIFRERFSVFAKLLFDNLEVPLLSARKNTVLAGVVDVPTPFFGVASDWWLLGEHFLVVFAASSVWLLWRFSHWWTSPFKLPNALDSAPQTWFGSWKWVFLFVNHLLCLYSHFLIAWTMVFGSLCVWRR